MNWQKLRSDKTLAHAVPLGFFLVFLLVAGVVIGGLPTFFRNHSDLPWWRRDADIWLFPVQAFLCTGLLVFWWKHYDFNWSLKAILIGLVMGVVGIAFWILPTQAYEWMGFSNDSEVPDWLAHLGVAERRSGFDARIVGGSELAFDTPGDWIALVLRLFRTIIIVSLVEEIFWRGFLMRWLLKPEGNFWAVPFGKPSWLTYGVVTVSFMLAHGKVDFAGAIAFGSTMYLVAIWTKSLGACIVAHAIANSLMAWYAISNGKLGLW